MSPEAKTAAACKDVPFERLIAVTPGRFRQSDPDGIDVEIERALAAGGEPLGVDRCFTFLVSSDGSRHRVRHVWTAPGIASDTEVIRQIMQEVFSWVGAKMLRHDDTVINRLDGLPPEASRELA